jgi:hypothetical protein
MARHLPHVLLLVAGISLVYAAPATAQKPGNPVEKWYGWQILVTDLAAFGFFLLSDYSEEQAPSAEDYLKGAGVVSIALGGPAVHVAHGRSREAMFSLGLRVVAPIAVGVVVYELADDGRHGTGKISAAGAAFLVTLAVGAVVDWIYLAHVRPDRIPVKRDGPRWAPAMVMFPSGGGGMAVAGSF